MVFVGVENAPSSHCGKDKEKGLHPITTVDETPVIVEKPYVVSNGNNGYSLMIPRLEKNKVGATPGYDMKMLIRFHLIKYSLPRRQILLKQ